MNYVQLVGYVVKESSVLESKQANRYSNVSLKVCSNFREHDGGFREEVYDILLWQGGHASSVDVLKEGDVLSCKGRLEKHDGEIVVVAESFERFIVNVFDSKRE